MLNFTSISAAVSVWYIVVVIRVVSALRSMDLVFVLSPFEAKKNSLLYMCFEFLQEKPWRLLLLPCFFFFCLLGLISVFLAFYMHVSDILSLRYYALEVFSLFLLRFLLLPARSLDLWSWTWGGKTQGEATCTARIYPAPCSFLLCDNFSFTKLYSWVKFAC